MAPPLIVGLCGALNEPSRTRWLAEHLVGELARATAGSGSVVGILQDCPGLGTTFERRYAPPALEQVLSRIERCDVLVAVTPVYKGGYAGLFKHLIDLLDMTLLEERPVIAAATGNSERHASVIDFHLRPLFSFFGARVAPCGVYAGRQDLDEERRVAAPLQAAIEQAVRQVAAMLPPREFQA